MLDGSKRAASALRNGIFAGAISLMMCSAAQADVRWYLSGAFEGGGALSGWFDINQYGFLADALITTGDGVFAGTTYPVPGTPTNNDAFSVSMFPNLYVDGLVLNFTSDLNVGVASNPLLITSYECRTNYCDPRTSIFRYLKSGGVASNIAPTIPEPASWALMIGGMAFVGLAMRRRLTAVQFA